MAGGNYLVYIVTTSPLHPRISAVKRVLTTAQAMTVIAATFETGSQPHVVATADPCSNNPHDQESRVKKRGYFL